MTRAPMLALLACAPALGRAELPSKQVLTLGVAKAVAEAAAIEAAIKGTRTTRTNGEPEARATR